MTYLGADPGAPRVMVIGPDGGYRRMLDRAVAPGQIRPVIIGRLSRMEDFLAMGTHLRVDLVLWSSFPGDPDEVGTLLQQVRRLRPGCGVLLAAPPAMRPRIGGLAADLYARRRRGEIPPAWIAPEQDLAAVWSRALAELGFSTGGYGESPGGHFAGGLFGGEVGPPGPPADHPPPRPPGPPALVPAGSPMAGGAGAVSGSGFAGGASRDGPRVLVCFGPKGGVGKTTVAAAMTAMAASLRGKAVLVDLDLTSPDTAVHFDALGGPDFVDMLPQLSEAPEEQPDVVPMEIPVAAGRLGLVAGPSRPELAELVEPRHVDRLLEALAASWPAVIVDTPAGFGDERVYRALKRAHIIVLLTSPDPAAVRQAALGLELLQTIDGSAGDRCLLVINQVHPADAVTVGRIEDFVGREAAAVIPRDRGYWERAVTAGRSVWTPRSHHPVAAAVTALGGKLGWGEPLAETSRPRWLRWLPWPARPAP